jgi:hypothetical protein
VEGADARDHRGARLVMRGPEVHDFGRGGRIYGDTSSSCRMARGARQEERPTSLRILSRA